MDYIKEDTVLGTKKVVIGDKFHDLVLENLGKIYIRYGNSYKEFNSIMQAISKGVASGGSKVIIEENGISDDLSIYPNGSLVYDARSGILYLIFNGEAFILAEHVNTNSSRYVLKTGDTMTGPLTINTKEAPLKVKSTELVKNFNANYLQGYDASAFARRNYNEIINGNWTFTGENRFTNKNTFEDTAIFTAHNSKAAIRVGTGDIITDGSIGSSIFVSGMNGSGWRLDAETNTLELDNLIVRGILNVYELVVNKVSATNGALWVTDSFKVKTVHDLEVIKYTAGMTVNSMTFSLDKYYLIYQDVTQNNQFKSFEAANSLLDAYNSAKITVDGECFSSRTRKETEPREIIVHKYVFQIISIEKLKAELAGGFQQICSKDKLFDLQKKGVIDVTCIYQYNTQDIPDKMQDYDEVFNIKFDQNYYKIVTNPDFDERRNKYYYDSDDDTASINLYYKYFGGGELFILESENDEYPVFRPGDVLRCQKFTGKSVKQYHGIVCGTIGSYGFIMQIQNHSILNRKTEVAYDEQGNLKHFDVSMDDTLYARSESVVRKASENINKEEYYDDTNPGAKNLSSKDSTQEIADTYEEDLSSEEFRKLCTPQEGDGLVRVGSIVWGDRRNSMYLTSSERYSPFQDIMVNVNRPDYSVVYFTPKVRKCTVQTLVDENLGIYKEQEVYLQNQEFSRIMDYGFDLMDRYQNTEGQAHAEVEQEYNAYILGNDYRIFSQYKDIVQRIEVPLSQSDKGDQDFYGLTNIKPVNLTYVENDYTPKYTRSDGSRVRVGLELYEDHNQKTLFYTAPKPEIGSIKVIETYKTIPNREETSYSIGEDNIQTKILIGKRV